MTPEDRERQALAGRVRDFMSTHDRSAIALGIRVESISPTSAVARMTVREDMLNAHQSCQGGLITTLADCAFAFACNACNELTLASGVGIDFIAPARLGDVLTASGNEVSARGRTGVYDVRVVNQDGQLIAVFRGRSYRIKGRPVVAP